LKGGRHTPLRAFSCKKITRNGKDARYTATNKQIKQLKKGHIQRTERWHLATYHYAFDINVSIETRDKTLKQGINALKQGINEIITSKTRDRYDRRRT